MLTPYTIFKCYKTNSNRNRDENIHLHQACAVRSGHGGDPPDPSIHGSLFSSRVGLKPSDWSFQRALQRAPPVRRPWTS